MPKHKQSPKIKKIKTNSDIKMKKKSILIVFWIISILYGLAVLSVPFFYVFYAKDFEAKQQLSEFIREYSVSITFRLAGLVTFMFWIYNLVIWNRRKDGVLNLLLLLFLNVLYAPAYFYFKEVKSFFR